MPPFLPQARPQAFGDLSNPLLNLADTVGDAVAQRRERAGLQAIGDAAATGNLSEVMRVAGEQGRPGLALQTGRMIEARADRAATREATAAGRAQAQSNADRTFNLQERQFDEGKRQFSQELEAKMRSIDGKNAKLENLLTPGQKATDKAFAKDFVDFNAGGGFADVEKQLGQLDQVADLLESGDFDIISGPVIGNIPDFAAAAFPAGRRSIATREAVEEVVQRNLRTVLGAQFTEREGERLIKRAFNPRLDEKENARRVRRLIGQIRTAAQQKSTASDYFEENGTLTGFRGQIPTFNQFNNGGDGGDGGDGNTPDPLEVNIPKPPPGFVVQ